MSCEADEELIRDIQGFGSFSVWTSCNTTSTSFVYCYSPPCERMLPSLGKIVRNVRAQLARVHDIIWIQRLLNGVHCVDGNVTVLAAEVLELPMPNAMFAGACTANLNGAQHHTLHATLPAALLVLIVEAPLNSTISSEMVAHGLEQRGLV